MFLAAKKLNLFSFAFIKTSTFLREPTPTCLQTFMNHSESITSPYILIIDDDIYSIGSSIKDVGKKRFVMTKIISISKQELLKNI